MRRDSSHNNYSMPMVATATDPLLNPGVMASAHAGHSPQPSPRQVAPYNNNNNNHNYNYHNAQLQALQQQVAPATNCTLRQHVEVDRDAARGPLPILMEFEFEDYVSPRDAHSLRTTPMTTKQHGNRARESKRESATAAKRVSVLDKVISWRKDLWDSVVSVEKAITKKAEETHRELSEEALEHSQLQQQQHQQQPQLLQHQQHQHNAPVQSPQVAASSSLWIPVKEDPQQMAIAEEKERMIKFFEFYKSHRDRRLRSKMDKLKHDVDKSSSALVQKAREEVLSSQTPTETAKNLRAQFDRLADQTAEAIDELQNELLANNTNYNHIVTKLKDMVIHNEGPQPKRSRTSSFAELQDEKESEAVGEKEEEEEEEEKEVKPTRRIRTVRSLTSLCVATCARYVDYLPEIPDGCFPEQLVQELLDLLIYQSKISDVVLRNLLSSTMLSLSLDQCKQLTSSSLNVVAFKSPFLNRVSFKDCVNISNDGVGLLASVCVNLEAIDMEGCVLIDDEAVTSIARKCSALHDINLAQCVKITDLAIQELVLRCPQLGKIILRKCQQITDGAFVHIANCAELRELDVYECGQISDKTLYSLVHCKKLRVLRVHGKPNQITDTGVTALTSSCGELQELELVSCDITDRAVSCISANCPSMHCLNLSLCKQLTNSAFTSSSSADMTDEDDGDHMLATSTARATLGYNLERLDLSRCSAIGDETVEWLASSCSNLKQLHLSGCEGVTDMGLLALARAESACRHLRDLSVSKCRGVTDLSLVELFRACPQLQSVNLENCNSITNASALALAQSCRNLTELDLTACDKIDDEGLHMLTMHCPKVNTISLEELSALTESGILGISRWSELKHLRLGYSRNVTNRCITKLVEECPDLISLDLSYCNNKDLTMEHLAASIQRWDQLAALHLRGINTLTNQVFAHPRLHTLNVSWCKHLDDEALNGIGAGCPQLQSIELAWCAKLTGAAIHRLAQRATALRTLNLRGCSRVPTLTVQLLTHAGKTVYR